MQVSFRRQMQLLFELQLESDAMLATLLQVCITWLDCTCHSSSVIHVLMTVLYATLAGPTGGAG